MAFHYSCRLIKLQRYTLRYHKGTLKETTVQFIISDSTAPSQAFAQSILSIVIRSFVIVIVIGLIIAGFQFRKKKSKTVFGYR